MTEAVAYLKALTPEAKSALGGQYMRITTFPFRVGRESRLPDLLRDAPVSRRRHDSVPNNDLYLIESGNVLNVSREHFLIDYKDGLFVLVDRGSTCGTLIEGDPVGEKKMGGWRQLRNNDVIIVGTSESRYVFKFVLTENP